MFRRALQQWRRDLKRLDEMRIKVHRTEGDSTDFSVDCQVRAAHSTQWRTSPALSLAAF